MLENILFYSNTFFRPKDEGGGGGGLSREAKTLLFIDQYDAYI